MADRDERGTSSRARVAFIILFCCFAVAVWSSDARAQAPDHVVHLWVGARYGDDALAGGNGSLNPNGSSTVDFGCVCPTTAQLRPIDVADLLGQPLLNVPYPFKTVTAAVQYINATATSSGAPLGTPPLPYTSPLTGHVWRYAIIHLLPGLYGEPLPASWGSRHHPDNGLVPNGETFPIHLPPNVSIQGTSTLDTFFDLRARVAFMFGVHVDPATGQRVPPSDSRAIPINGINSFVNRICFFGAGRDDPQLSVFTVPPGPGIEQGAIVIDEEVASRPTIVNCVFLKCRAGIIVNAGVVIPEVENPQPVPEVLHDGTTIINNSFIWNGVGLWNGYFARITRDPTNPVTVVGFSKLNIINNVFDMQPPSQVQAPYDCACNRGFPFTPWTWPAAGAGGTTPPVWRPVGAAPGAPWPWSFRLLFADAPFEGVCAQDMQTLVTDPNGGPSLFPENFNAFEEGLCQRFRAYNNRTVPLSWVSLHNSAPRPSGTDPIPHADRELSSYTGYFSLSLNPSVPCAQQQIVHGARGVLYVRDLLCAGGSHPQGIGFPRTVTSSANAVTTGYDGSFHDVRLSPAAARSLTDTSGPNRTDTHNPLVDNGYGGGFPAAMANGQLVSRPGFLTLTTATQGEWPFDAMEFDGEGFANPRVVDHVWDRPSAPARPSGWQFIDIGADELGELLIAGYRFGTRTFMALSASDPANPLGYTPQAGAMRNIQAVYLGSPTRYNNPQPPPPVVPPQFATAFPNEPARYRAYVGFGGSTSDWPQAYSMAWNNGLQSPGWISFERGFAPPIGARPWRLDTSTLVPLSPGCGLPGTVWDMYWGTPPDVTPHLLPDIHPWWSRLFVAAPNFMTTSNFLWQPCFFATGLANAALFLPPTTSASNPPGTYETAMIPAPGFDWLDSADWFGAAGAPLFQDLRGWEPSEPPTFQGRPFVRIEDFDEWCRGYEHSNELPASAFFAFPSTRIDPQSSLPPIAIRFSVEWEGTGAFGRPKNIQSFLVWSDGS
ncbi:MAG: hypothetical protein HZB39_08905 [Planctomycetes bacterium]|nr:hypothetical protein [Planctomycetota bacterium]